MKLIEIADTGSTQGLMTRSRQQLDRPPETYLLWTVFLAWSFLVIDRNALWLTVRQRAFLGLARDATPRAACLSAASRRILGPLPLATLCWEGQGRGLNLHSDNETDCTSNRKVQRTLRKFDNCSAGCRAASVTRTQLHCWW